MEQTIQQKYRIKPATLPNINSFRKLVGTDKFELILFGIDNVEIPLEEEKFNELMDIVLEEIPDKKITYDEAEEILSFFCKPFAGSKMKQAGSTLNGISSLFQKMDPAVLKTLMESGFFQKMNGTFTDVSSSQTETSARENESIQ